MQNQVCNCCGIEKPIEEFEWQKNRPNPRKTCKQCRYEKRDRKAESEGHKAYMRARRQSNPRSLYKSVEKSLYGVCKEDFTYQHCAICEDTFKLHIDHCHTTGSVRGLLCCRCNTGLGMFQDNISKLANAIKYLDNPPGLHLNKETEV